MPDPAAQTPSHRSLLLLSRLLLPPRAGAAPPALAAAQLDSHLATAGRDEFDDLVAVANSNHVVVRGLEVWMSMMREAQDDTRAGWAEAALAVERARIANAMTFLSAICAAFAEEGYDVTVIKSLDHWPDLGSDLDLYTNGPPEEISQLMKRRFQAQIAPRSWGDRLANKWSFLVPGLPEAVEIHMGRLGQTGEQTAIAARLPERARKVPIGAHTLPLPSAPDRVIIATLQRMYRHFYFRLCDIVDTVALAGVIDYEELRRLACIAGIWEGVATYLAIVSDYLKQYRDRGLDLPQLVTSAARFGGGEVYFSGDFLRVPIIPQSVGLYRSQLLGLLRKREFDNSARLGLLPWLAAAALVGQKITGSDKGVW